MPPADRERLRAQALAAYEQQFVPSWKRLEAFFERTYRSRMRPQIGFSSVPEGANAYGILARTYTTTRMTPEQIHQLGLQEVARIDGEMEAIARQAGFTGPASAYEQQLQARADMRYGSQEEMLTHAREVLRRIEPAMPRLFRRLPRAAVGVRPIAPDREAATASNYSAGTADGTRQAWFNMNTYRPHERSRYVTEALVLHETMPGHHLQIGLARELQGVPEFRRVFSATAFSEGWALYAESLGQEIGAVYRDPASRFGQLASEKFRAVRLVVDTGVHALGWSRERALAYFKTQAPSQSEAEVDRYIAWPGQALAYKVGELKIKDLRRRAEQRLGPRFDVRDFHEAVLRNGTLPLDLLEEQVEAYIASAGR
jgi:prolyl oligopeptidase